MKAKLYAGAAFVVLGLAAAYAMTSALETELPSHRASRC